MSLCYNYYANILQLRKKQCVNMTTMCLQIINGHVTILNLFQYLTFLLI